METEAYLQISVASAFTNEGAMTVGAGGTLYLGDSAVAESLANTGHITVSSGGYLEISDNFTLSGGAIVVSASGTETSNRAELPTTPKSMALDLPRRAASDSSTFVESDGAQYVYGDSYYATIGYIGSQEVESGGYAYGTNDGWNPDCLRRRRNRFTPRR